ncbi:YqjF family protein [Streptomyces sp. NPDC049687]|uniref:YqjF family protein n=1 Tax=Streptomyces sp. NPDC049687 TaxID=3365596 RepID=UPI0037B62CFA
MVAYGAEQRVWLPVLRAGWLTQTFVHWSFPPETVQALLPAHLVVEEYEGAAWVGLTPFLMADVRPPGMPAAVRGRTFPETNVRTYVRHRNGRDGLWFLTLEVGCPLMLAARAVGAPYHPGTLGVSANGDTVSYTGRRWARGPSYRLVVRPGDPIRQPTARDVWLTSRWRAYTHRFGMLWEIPVEHEPWPLAGAALEVLEQTLTTAVGLPAPVGEPVVHFSEGVRHVRLGASRPCAPAAAPS